MTSAIAAILALFVSIAAVAVTIISSRQQRTHNILTVKPIAEVTVADFQNLLRVKLRNHGSGPLLVKKLIVNFRGKQYDALIDCMPENDSINWKNFSGKVNDRALLPGDEIILVELEQGHYDPDFSISRELVRHALSYCEVVVEYSDIYSTKSSAYKKSLEWFGRSLA